MPLLSIIVPVYNSVDKGLKSCLDSILSQDFRDYELILVNDGSTDDSLGLCMSYQQKDARVNVIDQPNRGVSVARNEGLDVAKGTYITFVDSDDLVGPGYLASLMKYSAETDLVVCGIKQKFSNGSEKFYSAPEGLHALADAAAFHNLIKSRLVFGPCNKLFRTAIIAENKLRFPNNIDYGEDRIFCYDYLKVSKNYVGVPDVFYSYIIQYGNSLSTIYRKNLFSLEYNQWRKLYGLYNFKNNLTDKAHRDLIIELFWMVNDAIADLNKHNLMTIENVRKIVSISEIDKFKSYSRSIRHNWALKYMILHRMSLGIVLFYKLLNRCKK